MHLGQDKSFELGLKSSERQSPQYEWPHGNIRGIHFYSSHSFRQTLHSIVSVGDLLKIN